MHAWYVCTQAKPHSGAYVEQSLAIIATIIAQQAASDAGTTDHNPPSRAQGQGSCSIYPLEDTDKCIHWPSSIQWNLETPK